MVGDSESLYALLVCQHSYGPGPIGAPHAPLEAIGVEHATQGLQMSGYGNGSWDSVHAPEILIATFSNSAAASTLGRSAKGSGGAGGTKGWTSPTWSIITCVSGCGGPVRSAEAACPKP